MHRDPCPNHRESDTMNRERDMEVGMAQHACMRCGLESRCSHGSWADRHPVAAILFALPAGYTIIGVILAYPWFFVPLLVVAAAWWVDRRNRRRHAIAARADHEHRALMAAEVKYPPASPPRPRRCPADYWSNTQPMRAAR